MFRLLVVVMAFGCVSHGKAWEPVGIYLDAEIPALFYRNRPAVPEYVVVVCALPLTPSPDRQVWMLHPGRPVKVVPPTIRFEFSKPPIGRMRYVYGRVLRIDIDLKNRISRVPGIIVLDRCEPLLSIAPTVPR